MLTYNDIFQCINNYIKNIELSYKPIKHNFHYHKSHLSEIRIMTKQSKYENILLNDMQYIKYIDVDDIIVLSIYIVTIFILTIDDHYYEFCIGKHNYIINDISLFDVNENSFLIDIKKNDISILDYQRLVECNDDLLYIKNTITETGLEDIFSKMFI